MLIRDVVSTARSTRWARCCSRCSAAGPTCSCGCSGTSPPTRRDTPLPIPSALRSNNQRRAVRVLLRSVNRGRQGAATAGQNRRPAGVTCHGSQLPKLMTNVHVYRPGPHGASVTRTRLPVPARPSQFPSQFTPVRALLGDVRCRSTYRPERVWTAANGRDGPRKRVKVHALRGFKSHRYRHRAQQNAGCH
jgi:hypothetical protein